MGRLHRSQRRDNGKAFVRTYRGGQIISALVRVRISRLLISRLARVFVYFLHPIARGALSMVTLIAIIATGIERHVGARCSMLCRAPLPAASARKK